LSCRFRFFRDYWVHNLHQSPPFYTAYGLRQNVEKRLFRPPE
jgi:hypothetical protein